VLRHGFMQDWLDATRKRGSDRWRYLYKRTVEAMRLSPEFLREGTTKEEGTCYSLKGNNVSVPDLLEGDYRAIGLPGTMRSSLTYDDLKRSDAILAMAKHFWNEVSAIWGGEALWVPVRSFVDWVGLFVELGTERRVEAGPGGADLLDTLPDEGVSPDAWPCDEEKLAEWAGEFAASLSREEGVAFSLHCGKGMTLAAVAEEMGYRNPSGPGYLIEKAKRKLKCFVRDLQGLSPPDLDEEACALFMEKLLLALKEKGKKP
jgi:hypothetical protein